MFSISIDILDYFGKKEIFTLSQDFNVLELLHEKGNFEETDEVDRKNISKANFEKISKAFFDINFTELFNENPDQIHLDGWILTVSIQNDMAKISAQLFCPRKDNSKPETTKLLQACELICPLPED